VACGLVVRGRTSEEPFQRAGISTWLAVSPASEYSTSPSALKTILLHVARGR